MKTLVQLISPRYLDLQRALHARPDGYGGKGRKWVQTVMALISRCHATSVLDYGCGQGTLARELRVKGVATVIRIEEYDPAIPGKDNPPLFADLVTCTDVLEHIEPDRLPAVLEHLHMLARKAVFFVVALDPANKTLEDGRNAHLILESAAWWEDRIRSAGFIMLSDAEMADLPLPVQFYNPLKRSKRWIAVGVPC
jgi:hypothetical protein